MLNNTRQHNDVDRAGNVTKKGGAHFPSDVQGRGGVEPTKEGGTRTPTVGVTGGTKKGSTHSPSAVGGTAELTYNALGLVTVFVTWYSCTSGRKEPLKDQTAITQKVCVRVCAGV